MRVLILGGTGEGRALAERLAGRPGVEVISSLAGRLARPVLPAGQVRIGGFGAEAGLRRYLMAEGIERVIDATHPFAARITAGAVTACSAAGVPLLVLRRAGWVERPGDRWQRVGSVAAAAALVAARPPGTVLLTVGRRDAAAFADDAAHRYVVRSVDPPAGPLPPRHVLVPARGPFTPDGERALLRQHRVTVLVSRDSGGPATAAKLVAAGEAGVPVVLIDRPPLPGGAVTVATLDDALAWLGR